MKKMSESLTNFTSSRFPQVLRLLQVCTAFLVLFCGVSCSDDEGGPSPESQRVAFWDRVVKEHPDLPDKVDQVADKRGTPAAKQIPGGASSITIHSYLGPVTFQASTISAIVTDLDGSSLRKLSAYLKTIPERARELGVVSGATRSDKPRVVVLGSDGRIDIQGASDYKKQSIDIFNETVVGETAISIHSFDGDRVIDSLLESLASANQARGPPRAAETVIVIGKLKAINIEGASGSAEQSISFNHFFNKYAEESATRRMYTEAAAVAGVAYAATRAATRSTGSSKSSGGSRPKGGGRRR